MDRRSLFAILALAAAAPPVRAQCPDGSPPPCRGMARPAIVRANPPLNANAWIVVPFGNVTKSPELEWLRDASVNLLSLDMSRWTDVSVVPDKRVGDLVRELPPARSEGALTLNDGMALARRAGAGMLVMGDVIRFGRGARIVANVFDVRTGARIRSATQQAGDQDSLLAAFAPLARAVLSVPPPPDARTGDLGTQSLAAYQAYLVGVKALHRFDLVGARQHLTRALGLDSMFALAHLQYALMLNWGDLSARARAEATAHARAAKRLGANLPRRERALVDAGVAITNSPPDYAKLCEIARPLAAQDSTDIQAVFLLGECSYRDDVVLTSATDSTTGSYRGNWNTAIKAFTRVIELDPTYLGAFERSFEILQRGQRSVACDAAIAGVGCLRWTSYVLRVGDTLQTVPVRVPSAAAVAQRDRFRREAPRRANIAHADRIAEAWVAADPGSQGASFAAARVKLLRGDLDGADAYLSQLSQRATTDNLPALRLLLEFAGKRGRGAAARALFDSLVKAVPDSPATDVLRGGIELMFGRFARLDRGFAVAAARYGPDAVTYARHAPRTLLGIASPDMARDEAAFFASLSTAGCDENCRLSTVQATLAYGLHMPNGEWSMLVGNRYTDGRLDAARALAIGDSGQLRRAAMSMDSLARVAVSGYTLDPFSVIAADAYLALRDSASALRMARFFVDESMAQMSAGSYFISGFEPLNGAALWPRMMLMRADLAAAAGQRAEARQWYASVLDLWADADAEMLPVVSRIRRSLAALGPS